MAFLGASIQYASCLLGVKYREKAANGDYSGGPMYYLSNGLGLKSLAALFAGFTLFGAVTVGNFAQINSVVLPLEQAGLNPLLCALGLAILVGIVIVGGINRVARLASFIVPLKALLYLGTAWFILGTHASQLLPAFKLMFQAAFSIDSTIGGIAGFTLSKALTTGFERGIFATDAGTGIVPILQSSTRASDSVENGIATLVAPFLVMVVCTTTGLVLLVTGAWQESGLQSTNMVTFAFQKGVGGAWGAYIVIGALLLFAYTTILAWACCGEKALSYLAGSRSVLYFKIFYILLIPLGAWIDVKMIWLLADIAISLMLLTNIVGIAGLAHEVIRESRRYFCQKVEMLK